MENEVTITFKPLLTKEEWIEAFPIVKQLRKQLTLEEYLYTIEASVKENEYRMVGLYNESVLVAVVGFMPIINLYNGRYIFVTDLVTDLNNRSMGYGHQLLSYVEDWAKTHNYNLVELSSGVRRLDAHRFYEEKMSYHKVSYVFRKNV